MKVIFKYYVIYNILFSLINSETRYIDEIFDEVTITENIIYGNAPDLPFIFLFESNTSNIDLKMDIYEPSFDSLPNRPAILFIHSGSFITGNKNLDDMVSLATSAAKRGYVGITINYRLGMNVLSSYSAERAVYRGVQDLSAAIRYIRQNDTQFRINSSKIFAWGSSAGSFIALHLLYMDENERPESTFGGLFDPDLGCINCQGNNYIQNEKPNAIISCWGAIGDLSWIDQYENNPIIMFHGTDDLIVPHNQGYPFSALITLPIVYGSAFISNKLNELNINHTYILEQNQGHEYYGTVSGNWINSPNDYFYDIQNMAYNFLYDEIQTYQVADINFDGLININDLIEIINIVLLNNSNDSVIDLNNDGILNIFDVLIIVNLILGN